MALFKVFKGQSSGLPKTYNDGYCYVTTDDGKMYIDTTNTKEGRIVLNAGTADKLANARKISLTGDVTGSVNFDGSDNVSITATVVDNSHTHQISTISGLQDKLNPLNSHVANTNIHVTADEKNNWNQAEENQNAIGSFSINSTIYSAPNKQSEVELHSDTLNIQGAEGSLKQGDIALYFNLPTQSDVTPGTYGPSAKITTPGTAAKVPEITVDAYGRITKITNREYNPNFIKNISIDTSQLLPQLQYQTGDGTTKTVGSIDYQVLQSKLYRYGDSLSYANIPLLLSYPIGDTNKVESTYFYSEFAYNPSSGYLTGVRIDCGTWESFSEEDLCCFIAGTQILVDLDGTTKNIEDIVEGDTAVAYDLNKQENYLAVVKKIHIKKDVTDTAIVSFDNGTTLTMNAYHPIYTINGYHSLTNHKGYDKLVVGDICKTENGWSTIINIDRFNSNPTVMFSLDVIDINENEDNDTNDNFFANGIVVHNASCPT